MISRLFILIVALTLATQSSARVIEVRSGEHDTFSRIIMSIPVGTKWNLTQGENSAQLRVRLPDIKFDTSKVFDKIPHTRVTSVFQSRLGGPLQFTIQCKCNVTGFVQSGTLLVIDIQDFPETDSPSLVHVAATKYSFSHVLPTDTVGTAFTWGFSSDTSTYMSDSIDTHNLDNLPKVTPRITAKSPPPAPLEIMQTNVNSSEARLLAQINRAASQGLLAPILPNGSLPNNITKKTHPLTNSKQLKKSLHVNLRVVTAVDRELADATGVLDHRDGRIVCVSSELVSVQDWGNTTAFGQQIGLRRSELYGEFDSVSQLNVTKLARNFLYFGFGAEAKQILKLNSDKKNYILTSIAEIFDYGFTKSRNAFLGQENCTSVVALWAYLAEQKTPNTTRVHKKSILNAFFHLPQHLKILVGPNLSQKFMDSGDTQSAGFVLRNISRTAPALDPALALAQANATLHHNDTEAAISQFTSIAQSDSDKSPQAMIDLIDVLFSTRRATSPEVPELISTYLSEFRNSDIGNSLYNAHILSLALNGEFDRAFAALLAADDNYEKQGNTATLVKAMYLLTERASNITFLKYSLKHIKHHSKVLPSDLENIIAQRLIDLGFPKQAKPLLFHPLPGKMGLNRKIMIAQISISEKLPHLALVELLGIEDSRVEQLRAQALLKIGKYGSAGISLEKVGANSGRAFWLAENWDAVLRQNKSSFSDAAISIKKLTHPETSSKDIESLAFAQKLVDSGLITRSNINNLLSSIGKSGKN